MDIELIRKYASRMVAVLANTAIKHTENYLDYWYWEDKREFWRKIVQLPPDSHHWELVKKYFKLMSDPNAPTTKVRTLYDFLREKLL